MTAGAWAEEPEWKPFDDNPGTMEFTGPLGRKMKDLPKLQLSECPPNYGRIVAAGWDTIQESWCYQLTDQLEVVFEPLQARAQEIGGLQSKKALVSFNFYEGTWYMHPRGKGGGVKYVIENEHFILMIKGCGVQYGINVRYHSAALWEYGWPWLHDWIEEFLSSLFLKSEPYHEASVSQAHFAFDFHSPAFSAEFDVGTLRKQIVCHSSTKYNMWGTSQKDETLTIGKNKKNLQIQAYNKSVEITDVSGKDWMYELWAMHSEDGEIKKLDDVWRLELRFGRDYLKSRNIKTFVDVEYYRLYLLAGALSAVRLSVSQGEDQIRNRPVHPLWSEAIRHCGVQSRLPIGRRVTGRREHLSASFEGQIAGFIRAAAVLKSGKAASSMAMREIVEAALDRAEYDPDADQKNEQLMSRYAYVDKIKG